MVLVVELRVFRLCNVDSRDRAEEFLSAVTVNIFGRKVNWKEGAFLFSRSLDTN